MIGLIEAVAVGVYAVDWAYHRWHDRPRPTNSQRDITIPIVKNGSPIPMFYGRVRIKQPVLAWNSDPTWEDPSYAMNMFFVVGIGFGDGTNVLHGMYGGDWRLSWTDNAPDNTGVPGETPIIVIGTGRNGEEWGTGLLEWFNGNSAQEIVIDGEDVGAPSTQSARIFLTTGLGGGSLTEDDVPGYRGYLTAMLYGINTQWLFGPNPTIPAYSFEASTYSNTITNVISASHAKIGDDANPVSVLHDLVTGVLGKGGVSTAYIHAPSWLAAGSTLYAEALGYSHVLDSARPLGEHIMDVLRYIDAVIYEDSTDGLLHIDLIRADFNPSTVAEINKTNCVNLLNVVLDGHQGLINKVRVVYCSRAREYAEDDESAQNLANAVGQSGIVNELVIDMPWITTADGAAWVAERELAARCRPIIKCRAIVDRSWYATNPGAVVKVNWTNPDISGLYFRVARVDRGTLSDGKIALDLILDTSAYIHRQRIAPSVTPRPSRRGGDIII